MKGIRRSLFSLTLLAIFGIAFSSNALSQNSVPGEGSGGCVRCVPAGQGWTCMAGGQGGDACTSDGGNCTLTNPCTSGLACSTLNPDGTKSKVKLEIGDNLVREVGKTDPRIALALISIRRLPPLSYKEGIINSAPIELNGKDVESHLAPNGNSNDYALQLKGRISESFAKGLSPTVYNFSIEKSSIAGEYILRLQTVESGSMAAALSTLEVTLTAAAKDAALGNRDATGEQLKATSWKIN